MHRRTLILGALSAFIAVLAGAFGAHALRERLAPDLLAAFETGARYQMYHALALVVLALNSPSEPLFRLARRLLLVGTLLFSGSLYLLALTDARWWGAVTPFGGLAFLAGWGCLAVAAFQYRAN